ncbi:MAG: tRNA (guanosine(37)-N1)-methyltransferase TrmD [Deltaproteobacteria bacterium]|nr:MAG: tRNA (guanosine(37)-N1)-methyltransferase TrmD [Deltaproteobacteria bacterium]
MRFDVLTIFPELLHPYLRYGVLGKAIEKGIIEVNTINIRDFAPGKHKNTDDRPYGGGEGMVMKPEPIYNALESIDRKQNSLVILLSPQGERFDQEMARHLSTYDQLILICGRYEGVDERVRILCAEKEISIGDYILTGGELAALVVIDAVSRLVPGVLGSELSNLEESFSDGLLEYPQYTRPKIFKGLEVPEILLSGNHEQIRKWRRRESIKRTFERRPDLLKKAQLTKEDLDFLEELKKKK